MTRDRFLLYFVGERRVSIVANGLTWGALDIDKLAGEISQSVLLLFEVLLYPSLDGLVS